MHVGRPTVQQDDRRSVLWTTLQVTDLQRVCTNGAMHLNRRCFGGHNNQLSILALRLGSNRGRESGPSYWCISRLAQRRCAPLATGPPVSRMLLQIDRITVNMQANSRRKLDPVHVQYAL